MSKDRRMSRWLPAAIALTLISGVTTAPTADASSGDLVWARGFGSPGLTGFDFGHAVAVDDDGNVYTTGTFSGTPDFDPGAGVFNLTSNGDADVFVSKLDVEGDFVWVRRMGSTGEDVADDLTLDSSGNILITGSFDFTADFDPGAGAFNMSPAGNTDAFVWKLDSDGNFVWARQFGGTAATVGGSGVAVGPGDNVFTTGSFTLVTDFDPALLTASNLTAFGGTDAYVSMLSSDGDFIWIRRLGGAGNEGGSAVTLDAANNVLTTGTFTGTANFDPGIGTSNLVATGLDTYVSKLDSTGAFIWARRFGGIVSVAGRSVAVDFANNVFVGGEFEQPADFDPGPGTFTMTPGSMDVFVAKLSAGGDFMWARQVGSTGFDGEDTDLAIDDGGNVYASSFFVGTADFDPGPGTSNLTSYGDEDAFVWKLNNAGGFVWVRQAGGTGGDRANGIAVDGQGAAHVTGWFSLIADFDVIVNDFTLTSAGSVDVFVWKLDGQELFSAVPNRLMDTRSGGTTVDGLFQGIGTRAAGSITELQVTGRGGVPADAEAVVLNITAVSATSAGFATVWPCGSPQPNTSNLNFQADETMPNLVITQIGTAGKVCLFTSAGTHMLADLNGFYPDGSLYAPLVPGRLLDTRPGGLTVDGAFQAIGIRAAGTTTELQITGRHGIPVDAAAVALNVTVAGATGTGYVTVYPCGDPLPTASDLNYVAGDTIPSLVISKIGAGGKICLFTFAGTHLIADVAGFYPAATTYTALVPGRLLDSRPGSSTVDGQSQGIGTRAASSTTELQVTGRHGVPADATIVVLKVTVTGAADAGFVTVYPCGAAFPTASNLNFVAGDTIPNLVITQIGAAGKVCLFTSAGTHLLADVNGYF